MFDPQTPVADIVLAHSATALAFDRWHIDYCCQGHVPLATACEVRNLEVPAVLAVLDALVAQPDEEADPRTAPTSALINRVIARQHRNLRATLTLLQHQAAAIAQDHGNRWPTLRVISGVVDDLSVHLLAHLDREEDELFPALLADPADTDVGPALAHMFDEHADFGARLGRLRELTDAYGAPEGSPEEIVAVYLGLEELESMVVRHHHVENHVLLPRFR